MAKNVAHNGGEVWGGTSGVSRGGRAPSALGESLEGEKKQAPAAAKTVMRSAQAARNAAERKGGETDDHG